MMKTKNEYTNTKLVKAIANTLGDNFFLCDMLDQEQLFELQGKLSTMICKYANNNNSLALAITKQLPKTFYTSYTDEQFAIR